MRASERLVARAMVAALLLSGLASTAARAQVRLLEFRPGSAVATADAYISSNDSAPVLCLDRKPPDENAPPPNFEAVCDAQRSGPNGGSASATASASVDVSTTPAGFDDQGNPLISALRLVITTVCTASATTGANDERMGAQCGIGVGATFRVQGPPGTPLDVVATISGPPPIGLAKCSIQALPEVIDASGLLTISAGCTAADEGKTSDGPVDQSRSLELTVSFGSGGSEECQGELLTWAGGRSGGFADPESWSPPQVPVFEEGGVCDTALVRGGRNVTIDLAAAARGAGGLGAVEPRGGGVVHKAGRLLVYDSEGLRPVGGRLELDALSPELGARSLEIGDGAQLLLGGGELAARHVALGAGGDGELEVVGPVGRFETSGRLGIGASGEGRLVVRQGAQVSSAEAVLGELDAAGEAVVQDAGTLWSTANLAVGLEYDGRLEILGGARVESERAFVDFLLEAGEGATASVEGRDAQGNRSTWSAQSLQVGKRGSVRVGDGGFLDVADNLLLSFGDAGAEGLDLVTVRAGGQLAAASLNVGGTMVLAQDALALVTQHVAIGEPSLPDSAGFLLVQGPSAGPQLDGPTELEIEAHGQALLRNGAQVDLLGPFIVGLDRDADARLHVVAGLEGTGEPSVLRSAAAASVFSVIGATSDEPAGVFVRPSGRLLLEGGRIELTGPGHHLRIGRGGLLVGRGGTISIEPPGKLVNRGMFQGGLTLDGSYEQVPGGTAFGQILSPGGTPLNRSVLDPLAAAEFPRRAMRKPAPAAFGPLVVTGDATLAGRVELQFGGGVAPRAGESFEVLDVAGTVTGEFDEVSIKGLVPGSYGFEPSLVGGKLALTSTTDAVALPAVSVKAKAKLKETAKKGGKIKLKRTGDTSAPLVVAYRVGGTARSGVDYEALPGTIEIPAKKKSATIVVRPLADGLAEGPETIELELVPGETFAPGAVSSAGIELLSKDE